MKEPAAVKTTEVTTPPTQSRRKFLMKSTAGVVITTLPAQSVWGACNASGLSGGSRTSETVCETPLVTGGRSPGSWRVYLESGTPSKNCTNKVRSMFSLSKSSDLTAAYCSVRNEITNMPNIVLSDGMGVIPTATLNIGTALGNSGGIWNLAAYYLNAYYGFYGDLSPYSNAEEFVQQAWAVLYINNGSSVPTDYSILENSFTDGAVDSSKLPYGQC
jgi:hypothetical protein